MEILIFTLTTLISLIIHWLVRLTLENRRLQEEISETRMRIHEVRTMRK